MKCNPGCLYPGRHLLTLFDNGEIIYLDCMVEKPKSAPVAITFGGVLDAKQIKGKVSRVNAFSMEQHDEGQEGSK